ncbi:MAG: hypothetical protein K1X72_02570 [Pyrinomonadaceae bacterium]|nr:hypothetical protein [Pyrinomonadaceae bacterium]
MNKRFSVLIFLFLFAASNLFAQTAQVKSFDPNYKRIFNNPTQDKNFYLLSMMQNLSDVRKTLNKNKVFKQLANQHADQSKIAVNCNNVKCYDDAFRFTDTEIETIAKELENSAKENNLSKLVENHLRPSGIFIRYDSRSNTELLVSAWRDAAKGVNHILDVFGLGRMHFIRTLIMSVSMLTEWNTKRF